MVAVSLKKNFFKQKTAYEITTRLVGSEMCIRDSSIISTGCTVGKGVEISDSVIMPDVTIENGAVIRSAIIAEGCHIKAGARVGDYVEGEERKISVIGKDKTIAEGTVIDAGAIV